VPRQDALGQRRGRLGVEARQFVHIVVKGARGQPLFATARAEQDERLAAGQVGQQAAQRGSFGFWQRVLDGQVSAGDGLQVVQQQQVARRPQSLRQHGLLRLEVEGDKVPVIGGRGEQRLGDGVHDLLARPGPLVVAKVEHVLHEAGRLPPGSQVVQQHGLACAAHAAHEQEVAAQQQALFDLHSSSSTVWLK
jgi:hypothetical protein